jgi:hypothetical protein
MRTGWSGRMAEVSHAESRSCMKDLGMTGNCLRLKPTPPRVMTRLRREIVFRTTLINADKAWFRQYLAGFGLASSVLAERSQSGGVRSEVSGTTAGGRAESILTDPVQSDSVQQSDDTRFDCPAADELAGDNESWRIYEESFPPEEREPIEVILDSVRRSLGTALRVRHAGVTVGIATTHLLLHPTAVFLVYLAVDRRYRDAGNGATLFEYAWSSSEGQLWGRGYNPLGFVWEVDDPREAGNPDEELLRRRRIRFFQRQGGAILSRPYLQPPVNGTEPVPMQLMYRPNQGATMPDAATVEALVRAIYFEKYGEVNGIPRQTLQSLLTASLPPRI